MAYVDSTKTNGSATIAVPSGSDGDVLAVWGIDVSTPPAGWSTYIWTRTNAGLLVRMWTKVRAGEVTGSTLTWTGSTDFPVLMMADLSGVSVTPVHAEDQQVNSSVVGPSVSPSVSATLCFFAWSPDQALSGTPSGMSLRQDNGDNQLWTSEVSSGATGTRSLTAAGSATWLTSMAAFEVAGGPTITSQPSSTQVPIGSTASFSVTATASGGGTLSYQWKLNGVDVTTGTGGTTANYTTAALAITDNLGSYTCLVTETGGSSPGSMLSSAAIAYVGTRIVGANTPVYSTSGGTSVAPSYSTLPTIQAGDEILLVIAQKPSTANSGSVTTPTGYTLIGSLTGAGGYGATLGNNTGNTNLFVYRKTTPATGSESGTLSVTVATNNVCSATFVLVRAAPGSTITDWAFATGSDTTGGNVSVTVDSDPGIQSGDAVFLLFNGASALATYSGEAVTTTGVTYGTVAELAEPSTTVGNDVAGFIAGTIATAGPSSAAPVFTATVGGTTTNARGPGILVRARASSQQQQSALLMSAVTLMG